MSKLFFLFLTLLLSAHVLSQSQWKFELTTNLFPSKEIADSGFREVAVVKQYYNYQNRSIVMDTIYVAKFSTNGLAEYECKMETPNDTDIVSYSYDDSARITRLGRTWHGRRGKGSSSINYFYKDGKQSEVLFYYGKQKLYYDKKGRLSRTESDLNDSSGQTLFYYYDNKDSLIRLTSKETYGSRIDSIVTTYKYDKKGRTIEKNMRPTNTYVKYFAAGCGEGLYEYWRRKYDSSGRIVVEKYISEEEEKRTDFFISARKEYSYFENGFVCKDYDSENRVMSTSLYTRFPQEKYDGYFVRENYDEETKMTKYVSEKTNFPVSINYPGKDIYESVTYLFFYKK